MANPLIFEGMGTTQKMALQDKAIDNTFNSIYRQTS